jgi:hypothetical protein
MKHMLSINHILDIIFGPMALHPGTSDMFGPLFLDRELYHNSSQIK